MSNDEEAIRTWLNDWLRASAKGDSETMLAMLTDDMVFLVPGQPPFGKKEFKAAWDGPMKGARIESKADLEECIVSANTACTRTRLIVGITAPDGKSPERAVTRSASSASSRMAVGYSPATRMC